MPPGLPTAPCRLTPVLLGVLATLLATLQAVRAPTPPAVTPPLRPTQGGEFCEFDLFEAKCPNNHVILIKTANFGRMRLGKCVTSDLGFVGCQSDVLDIADRKCSGRRECSIKMPDEEMASRGTCLTELKSYLQISYTCIKVVGAVRGGCGQCDHVSAPSPAGYLASVMTATSGCGAPSCPWRVLAQPGQRINVTLHDFHWTKDRSALVGGGRDRQQGAEGCQVYGTIKEETTTRTSTVCSGRMRSTHVYTSLTHALEVRLVGSGASSPTYMFEYQVLGCPDPDAPSGGWMTREGDMVRMGCNTSGTTWRMRCEGSAWEGEAGSCDGYAGPGGQKESMFHVGGVSVPSGISIVIIVAVALVVGALILCVGVIIVKRRYSSSSNPPGHLPTTSFKDPYPAPPSELKYSEKLAMTRPPGEQSYVHIWDRPLPEPQQQQQQQQQQQLQQQQLPVGGGGGGGADMCTCPPPGYSDAVDHRSAHHRHDDPTYYRHDDPTYNTLGSVTSQSTGMTSPSTGPGTVRHQVYGNNTIARREVERDGNTPEEEDNRYFQIDPDDNLHSV